MPSKAKPKSPDTVFPKDKQLRTAEAAFETVRPRLDAMLASEVDVPRIDLQAAAVQALGVARTLTVHDVHTRIVALADVGLVDLQLILGLETIAWATWFARHKVLEVSATHTQAALPVTLTTAAAELRGRMLKTLAYHLEGDALAMAQIAGIRAGSGHLDLANDLVSCATMYRKHHAAIEHDRTNYRPTDAAEADTLSEQILRLLGVATTAEQSLWKGYASRAAKLLFQHYQEAIRIGRFLWHDDNPEGRFPTLHSATRATPQRSDRKGVVAPIEASSGTPVGETPGEMLAPSGDAGPA